MSFLKITFTFLIQVRVYKIVPGSLEKSVLTIIFCPVFEIFTSHSLFLVIIIP